MAVEEKQSKKQENSWSNPFSGRYESFVDEKGFGKFHLLNLNTSKQITLDSNRGGQPQTIEILGGPNAISTSGSVRSGQENVDQNITDSGGGNHMKEIEDYKKLLQHMANGDNNNQNSPGTGNTENQAIGEAVDPKDPLSSLIKQINQLKQKQRAIEGEISQTVPPQAPENPKPSPEMELLQKLITESKHVQAAAQGNSSEQCPNVNPFPLAALLQPNTGLSMGNTVSAEYAQANEKQIIQQRLIDRIKGAVTSQHQQQQEQQQQQSAAVTTLTNSPYISPIPAVRLEPSPKTGLQMKDIGTLDSDNIRLLRLLIPNFSQSGGTPPPNYTAVPVNSTTNSSKLSLSSSSSQPYSSSSPQPYPTSSSSSSSSSQLLNGIPTQQQTQIKPTKQGVVMDNDKCLEMFQNIKKQISDQSVFNLTATIHQTSNESEGLILVVTRNKIDIHPQFGPIHVARVVITNKLYYKFFVLDKVVCSGQVGPKEISEVFWKLSDVSQHLLCPGFNQRYISKVEQTLGEKVDDITTSYCRLTAKLCTVWHQKDSKPGQCRNYHTRDLCSECLDLYHRLQFKTYSHTKLKQGGNNPVSQAVSVQQPSQQLPITQSWNKREQDTPASNQLAKKPKLNGPQYPAQPSSVHGQQASSALNEQQLKAMLSNFVNNSRVVQLNKETEGSDDAVDVDICGEDSSDAHTPNSFSATPNPLHATPNPLHATPNPSNTTPSFNLSSCPTLSTVSNRQSLNTSSISALLNSSLNQAPTSVLNQGTVIQSSHPTSHQQHTSYSTPLTPSRLQTANAAQVVHNLMATSVSQLSSTPAFSLPQNATNVTLGLGPHSLTSSLGLPSKNLTTSQGLPSNSLASPSVISSSPVCGGSSPSFVDQGSRAGTPVGGVPNMRVVPGVVPGSHHGNGNNELSNENSSPPFATAGPASAQSKIDDILASLNELQKSVPDMVRTNTNSVDENIRNLLKQFQSDRPEGTELSSAEDPARAGRAQEGAENGSLGDETDSQSQEEDSLVIQED